MCEVAEGQVYRSEDGEVRVDRVTDGWVYYVAWRLGQEVGEPKRMTPSLFRTALEMHQMKEVDCG